MAWSPAVALRSPDADITAVGVARALFVLVASVGVGVHAAFALAGSMSVAVDDWLYCGLYLLAAASCAYRARRGDARAAWTCAALGVLVWGSAEILFRLQASSPHAWYPRATQTVLFVGFSLAYVTLALLARERVRTFDVVLAMDGLLAGLAAASLAALLLFPVLGPSRAQVPATPPQVFLVFALVGLMFVITVVGMTGWRPGAAWALITAAIAINVVGDGILVHVADAGRFHRGSFADTLFVSSALLLGLAAFHPSRRVPLPHDVARRLPVPLVSAAVALGVLIAAVASDVGGMAAGLAAAALTLTIARMTVALELLERSRTQALADELTGLGNRRLLVRELTRRFAHASAERPFVLALFDLDGFKRYNDTFGHPSGDALLARLARRLSEAVSPDSAYRMGGDEFCALLDGERERINPILDRARRALTERGDAFAIVASAGAVACPAEASTVTDALAIADGRMYVAKTGRSADQVQTRDAVLKMLHERDPDLYAHLRAVGELAERVARQLGLDEPTVRQVQRAAELHDIGKIAVPDAILHKPGPLEQSELQFMRQYPIVGERIARAAPSLAPIAPLVRSAHERWDGRGYPDGLRRDEAPIGARIIAACDAYDSMRSSHPYRSERSLEEALGELRRCSGSQFDPTVIDALCQELAREQPA
jgi:two-component system cell cycle response regulator